AAQTAHRRSRSHAATRPSQQAARTPSARSVPFPSRNNGVNRQSGAPRLYPPRAVDEIDLTDVEREICRLPDVSIARLVGEPDGRISEVHIVAHPGKHPKQIVRDVQSIALASFGLDLARRVI